ncbi:MAG TPA: heme ABC transporter ATP-binding protein [Verrucomicrobiae bacterium]|nr:heme ABC transporter ATP-binding protein [Verrucomicrobiae bacterium]
MSYCASVAAYAVGGRRLVDHATLRIDPGSIHALLGPNGAGKSTLLRLLSGELEPDEGAIELNGKPLRLFGARELARQRAVLPQSHGLAFGFTAAQVVALGRLPCARRNAAAEAQIVEDALALAGVAGLAQRRYPTLSGGERARVQLARVMAQVWEPAETPRYLLLDEPTASLDLAHQHDCLRAVRALAGRGVGVLVILHDPNLALRHADRVTLLRDGRVLASGAPDAVIDEETLTRLYRVPVRLLCAAGEAVPVVVVGEHPEKRDSPLFQEAKKLKKGTVPGASAPPAS